jgi:hypothetical protein
MNDAQQKAQELANAVNAQILEARQELAQRMLEKGQTEETHMIYDNLVDVIEGGDVLYRCWTVKRTIPNEPRMKRGEQE